MQNSWQERILKEFIPQVNRLTLVADPDYLVTEEILLQKLRERGFDILLFEDPVAFRFAYESKYRSKWDNGDSIELVVVVHEEATNLHLLPYDIFQTDRKLSFSLGDMFPNLSYSVIKALDRGDLEPLYQAYLQYTPGKLGDNATKDFLLSRVFDLNAEFIRQPADLLRVLLRRHYRDQQIPKILDLRFIQVLHRYGRFEDWPLETIIQDRETFFSFLQERWPIFLNHITLNENQIIRETATTYTLKYSGPPNIPFDNEDVRVYIDSLFLDGLLQPVPYPQASKPSQQWITVGVRLNPEVDRMRRLERLIRSVEAAIPIDNARYQDWFAFAHRWSELIVLWYEANVQKQSALEQQFFSVQKKLDTTFQSWVMKRYSTLHNLPPTPPVMLHHIAHDIAQYIQTASKEKVALITIDGLASDQWIVLREVLSQQGSALKFRENMVFAWLPTITSVSRQSIFAGKLPLYYPESIFKRFPDAIAWPPFGLPENFLPLLAPNRSAFISEGKRVVGHGGISIDELIVPYVQVRRETK
jgi:hypothetical protein